MTESVVECMACLRPVARYGDVCNGCSLSYSRGWIVGQHRGGLRGLIGRYKFDGVRAAGFALATLLDDSLPVLPNDVIVTSVPTARPHIRERGYDHAAILAREFARLRQLPCAVTLTRLHNNAQRGSSRKARIKQASTAFGAVKPVNGGTYLLVDDVCTTGATVYYAAEALRKAGAREVWVAVISREPLD